DRVAGECSGSAGAHQGAGRDAGVLPGFLVFIAKATGPRDPDRRPLRAPMKYPLRLAVFAGLLTLTGCPLSTYESRMGEEQERLEYTDEEGRVLDLPVEVPEVKDGNKVLIKKTDVFFRPPRGTSRKPAADRPYGPLINVYAGRSPTKQVF